MDPPAVIVVALLCACLLPLAAGQDSPAPDMMITYHVANEVADTDVGMRFDELFGEGRMEQIMSDATAAVWETLEINNYPENTNAFTDVYLTVVHNFSRWEYARYAGLTTRNKIELNSWWLSRWDRVKEGGMEPWVHALVYHEVTHVWQVYPPGPHHWEAKALKEGTANYVAMRAGHTAPDCTDIGWILRSSRWWEGYCPTMYLLRYLATPSLGGDGIVAEINRRLNRHGYKEDDFVDLLGSTPYELWLQFLDTLPADDLNIGLQQLVVGAGQAGRSKAATSKSYVY